MKLVNEKVATKALNIDEDFATLVEITPSGDFDYEFRLETNVQLLAKNSAFNLKVSVAPRLPVTSSKPKIENVKNLGAITNNILVREISQKDAKTETINNRIDLKTIDLTASVNNNVANKLSTTNVSEAKKNQFITKTVPANPKPLDNITFTRRAIELKTTQAFEKSSVTPPVLQVFTETGQGPPASNRQVQASAARLLENAIDPSIASTKLDVVKGTSSSFAGVSKLKRLPGETTVVDSTSNERNQSLLVESLLSTSKVLPNVRVDFDANDLIPFVAKITTPNLVHTKRLVIPRSKVGASNFYVTFELINSDGVIIENATYTVQHATLLRLFDVPKEPPYIFVAPGVQRFGRNVVEVKQTDSRAEKIRLYRRIIKSLDATNESEESQYKFVTEIPLKKSDGSQKIVDIVSNANTVVYRSVAISPSGVLGSEFTNCVAAPVIYSTGGRQKYSNIAAVTCKIVKNGIDVTVLKIPTGVVAVAVVRRDATAYEAGFSYVDTTNAIRVLANSTTDTTFFDSQVKEGHLYEYGCLLYYADGVIVESSAYDLVKYSPISSGAVAIEVSNLRVVQNVGILDIKFDLRSLLVESSIDSVKKALETQGLYSLFENELKGDKDTLQQLIAHYITRLDMTDGTREDLGVFVGNTFSDRVLSMKVGASPLKPSHRYKYIVSTLLRKAETVIDSNKKAVVDDRTGSTYEFQPAFMNHPITLKTGTLVSRESLKKNYSEDDFTFGNINNFKEIDVTFDNLFPKVVVAKAEKVGLFDVNVSWNVEGDAAKFDHFIILKERLKQLSVVGKSHTISTSNSYEFYDFLEQDDIGKLTYHVVPVYLNYSRGQPVITNSITVTDVWSR